MPNQVNTVLWRLLDARRARMAEQQAAHERATAQLSQAVGQGLDIQRAEQERAARAAEERGMAEGQVEGGPRTQYKDPYVAQKYGTGFQKGQIAFKQYMEKQARQRRLDEEKRADRAADVAFRGRQQTEVEKTGQHRRDEPGLQRDWDAEQNELNRALKRELDREKFSRQHAPGSGTPIAEQLNDLRLAIGLTKELPEMLGTMIANGASEYKARFQRATNNRDKAVATYYAARAGVISLEEANQMIYNLVKGDTPPRPTPPPGTDPQQLSSQPPDDWDPSAGQSGAQTSSGGWDQSSAPRPTDDRSSYPTEEQEKLETYFPQGL